MDVTTTPAPSAPGPLAMVGRWLARLETALAGVAALAIFAIMLFGVLQVTLRVIWKFPIPGYIDYVEQLMVLAAFVAIAHAERLGAHIRMDYLPALLRGRGQQALELLLLLIALLTISFLTYATWFSFLRALQLGDSTMDVELKVWPGKLVLVLSLALLWMRIALSAIGYAYALAGEGANRGEAS
jgi:C4-dicarboxylate transporter DctQ subunit